jgi:hypothetical protein
MPPSLKLQRSARPRRLPLRLPALPRYFPPCPRSIDYDILAHGYGVKARTTQRRPCLEMHHQLEIGNEAALDEAERG